ncbi:L7Ae/L30e/S12e/Gadd45 family ribosomal protein [Spiroplasma chrysopicola]|uniref:Putative 50S ribosomal protein L7Ae n=1 Tax=Spiroplasma chrysopicola DF-1 TaxID=1276227 RepID=R4U1Z6_9MOLU|nr:50S ribosomal protein L7ae [Spiroplasma chrysopicola]AGM25362.1 putative 50S ribosomal protein L7Ae [Spiroplasma chrysopicola DF-1]
MDEKGYNYLGLAMKARKISTGSTLLEHIKKKKVFLVLSVKTMGQTQEKRFSQKCFFYQIPYFNLLNETTLYEKLGINNIKVFGITDINLAKQIIGLITM